MILSAIMPARSEAWVLGLSARAALVWNDNLILLDHASSDETPRIAAQLADEYPGRVYILTEPLTQWDEMDHRQRLLDFARGIGSTHVSVPDADEILCGDMLPKIRTHIERLQPGHFVSAKMRNLYNGINEFRSDDSPFGSRAGTMLAFADAPNLRWKARGGYQHHQRSPLGSLQGPMLPGGGIMHLQFADWRRLVQKHRWYRVSERLKYPDKPVADIERMYSLALDTTGMELSAAPSAWWEPYLHLLQYLDLTAVPWQERAVEEAIAAHGREHFAGLNISEPSCHPV